MGARAESMARTRQQIAGNEEKQDRREQIMTAEQNIETARQMYDAFGRGDVQAILDRVTGGVDWSTDAATQSAPWYGPRHGKDGVVSFFEAIGKTGPVTDFTPLAFASNDDGDVRCSSAIHGCSTGVSVMRPHSAHDPS